MCAEILFLRGCALRKLRAASGDLDARNFAMRPERKGLGAGDSGLWRGIRVVALFRMRCSRDQNNAGGVEGDGGAFVRGSWGRELRWEVL